MTIISLYHYIDLHIHIIYLGSTMNFVILKENPNAMEMSMETLNGLKIPKWCFRHNEKLEIQKSFSA